MYTECEDGKIQMTRWTFYKYLNHSQRASSASRLFASNVPELQRIKSYTLQSKTQQERWHMNYKCFVLETMYMHVHNV